MRALSAPNCPATSPQKCTTIFANARSLVPLHTHARRGSTARVVVSNAKSCAPLPDEPRRKYGRDSICLTRALDRTKPPPPTWFSPPQDHFPPAGGRGWFSPVAPTSKKVGCSIVTGRAEQLLEHVHEIYLLRTAVKREALCGPVQYRAVYPVAGNLA